MQADELAERGGGPVRPARHRGADPCVEAGRKPVEDAGRLVAATALVQPGRAPELSRGRVLPDPQVEHERRRAPRPLHRSRSVLALALEEGRADGDPGGEHGGGRDDQQDPRPRSHRSDDSPAHRAAMR